MAGDQDPLAIDSILLELDAVTRVPDRMVGCMEGLSAGVWVGRRRRDRPRVCANILSNLYTDVSRYVVHAYGHPLACLLSRGMHLSPLRATRY